MTGSNIQENHLKQGIYLFFLILIYLPSMCMSRDMSIIHNEYTVLCSELRNVIFFRILDTFASLPLRPAACIDG